MQENGVAFAAESRIEGNLGLGRPATIRDDIETAISLDPTAASAWPIMDGLGPALADGPAAPSDQKSKTDDVPKPPEIVEIERQRAEIGRLVTLARRLASSPDKRYRDGPRAVQLATETCELTDWSEADCLETLAAACAEAGDFAAAVRWQTKALEKPDERTFDNSSRRRLRLYQASRPFHEELW